MKCAVLLLACFVAAECAYSIQQFRPDFPCDKICSRYAPEPKCGEDGKTYQNDCFLECKWQYKECDGPCPCFIKVKQEAYCYCEKTYKPVCAGGETKDNKCVADCEGKPVWYDGPCYDSFGFGK